MDSSGSRPTSLSNTQEFRVCSGLRQCHNCWLLFSKHCQCFRNSSRQFLLMSSKLRSHGRQRCTIRCHAGLHRVPLHFWYTLPPLLNETAEHHIQYLHTSSTPRNLPPFPHAIYFPFAMRLGLAFHIVIVKSGASCANEERCTEQRSWRSTDFCYFGDGIGEWGGIDENGLVEAVLWWVMVSSELDLGWYLPRLSWRHLGYCGNIQWVL